MTGKDQLCKQQTLKPAWPHHWLSDNTAHLAPPPTHSWAGLERKQKQDNWLLSCQWLPCFTIPYHPGRSKVLFSVLLWEKLWWTGKKKTLFLATYFCCFIIFESHLNFFKLKASECFSSCLWTSERELYPLKLELQTGGSCHVGAGTRTQVLWRAASALDCQPLCTPLFIFK